MRRMPGKGITTALNDECDDEEITELNGEASDEDDDQAGRSCDLEIE